MRPFHRHLKLENLCRNKEMGSYFTIITFFKNQQVLSRVSQEILRKMSFSQKNKKKCCFSQETYGVTCFITQYTIQDKNDRFGLCFSSMVAKIHLQGVQQ